MADNSEHSTSAPGLDKQKWPWKTEPQNISVNDGPNLSIITPSYNQADYIEATLLSVLNQSYQNVDYIVMDGASTDGSVEILRKYESRLSRLESAKDDGQADAINKGISRAEGEWIAFLNSDDLYLPDALQAIARQLKQTKSRWVTGGVRILGDNGADYGTRYPDLPYPADLGAWLTYENQVPQQGCFVHRSVFDEIGQFDTSMHHAFDLDFWVRMSLAGIQPELLEQPLAVFRIQDSSKSMTGRLPFVEDHRKILEKHRDSVSAKSYQTITKKLNGMEANSRIYAAANWAEQEDRSKALKQLSHAFRLKKSSSLTRPFWGAVKRTFTGA